ncbi:MAG TPA: hypothetical protein VG650_13450 [Mycobacteriales bacterium]|nr:hypothetical protein [Mycobacteriales bacterium]
MNTASTRSLVAAAAETYGVKHPPYVVEAQRLADAATAYRLEVERLTEPSLESVTAGTISKVIDQVLAFDQRARRLELARRVEVEALVKLDAAFSRFKGVMLQSLAGPFDSAAATFMASYDSGTTPDPKIVATLTDLVRVRDLLSDRVDEGFPMSNTDLPTRVAVWQSRDDLIRLRHRANGTERGSQPWLEAVLSLGGRLKWQTRHEQIAHVTALPAHTPEANVA